MRSLTVDLASKFTAFVVRDHSVGQLKDSLGILYQGDSSGLSAFGLARKLRQLADHYQVDLIVIEDLPFNKAFTQGMTKAVTRLQGVVAFALYTYWEVTLWVEPSTWQRNYPGVAKSPKGVTKTEGAKIRIEAARVAALGLGYEPPDLVSAYVAELKLREGEKAKVLVKNTAPLVKSMTDYVDAFLLSDWCANYTIEEMLAMPGVSQFSI